ncbi:uncharacterized protein GGS25DRAFT_478537 [Hypoxylon fragiforme]|uniref:uncharacterized protein n=1 Tax=Hypoxylon fragiforme TaxID=63214 RepID=UPI0020C69714|nr:uncharacterized protein GGS25DRAFT_478537 [Hypoxylon fragiforme]KAI2613099.1 hypothetical protein GGS25DRAFT_478537 [Hypoxylon fragiforme]
MAPPPSVANPETSYSNDDYDYEAALAKLQPLRPVLGGFNHRNRNQHRRAAWWGAFGMLRRHVEVLVDELAVASALVRKKAVAAGGKKRKRDGGGGGGGGGGNKDGAEEKQVRGHVRWLRDVLVPKCYLYVCLYIVYISFSTISLSFGYVFFCLLFFNHPISSTYLPPPPLLLPPPLNPTLVKTMNERTNHHETK